MVNGYATSATCRLIWRFSPFCRSGSKDGRVVRYHGQGIAGDTAVVGGVGVGEAGCGQSGAFWRFCQAVAAGLLLNDDNTVRDARITLGAVAPTPKPVQSAGDLLVGRPLDQDVLGQAAATTMKAAEPICDVRGSAEFRREIVGVLTRRALITACQRARETD